MPSAIRANNLSKRYRLQTGPRGASNLTETLVGGARAFLNHVRGRSTTSSANEFWALRDVSFDVQPGECVGIIGRNGAGKSTLLKVLSRIVEPTSGRAEVRGRMGSLLEVGTGFHPELTGRENVFLNGSILGMAHSEIRAKFDAIVEFAGVERFLDTPVKRYSSGMYVRLAFAVAAHLEPEILVVDEVLAVGDAEFQKRCVDKMRAVSRTGHTVLLVSHNLGQVENLCGRVIVLKQGRVTGIGPAAEQIHEYLAAARAGSGPETDLREHPARAVGATPILSGLTVTVNGTPGCVARMDGGFGFAVDYRCPKKPRDLRVGIVIESVHGVKVANVSPTYQVPTLLDDPPAEGCVSCVVPAHNLVAGTYYLNVYVEAEGLWDAIEPAGELEIEGADVFGSGRLPDPHASVTYLAAQWGKSW